VIIQQSETENNVAGLSGLRKFLFLSGLVVLPDDEKALG